MSITKLKIIRYAQRFPIRCSKINDIVEAQSLSAEVSRLRAYAQKLDRRRVQILVWVDDSVK
jgi:hypothetical protein